MGWFGHSGFLASVRPFTGVVRRRRNRPGVYAGFAFADPHELLILYLSRPFTGVLASRRQEARKRRAYYR
jgi:hypothetical protein